MKLPIFKLENYWSTREFSARYVLGAADIESQPMADLLGMADEECDYLWKNLSLGYTESSGFPPLTEEISKLYFDTYNPQNILCFAGAEEGIFAACHALLDKGDHAITITPCYQSLASVPASLCSITCVPIKYETRWELDLAQIKQAIRPNTKLLLINYPHNPTGAVLTRQQQQDLVDLARSHGIWIFSDEVYRLLELDTADRLPPTASIYEKGLSLGVMSKAFGFAGLRVGWIATQDHKALKEIAEVKNYLSICNSAPSEILSLIALRNKDAVLKRGASIMQHNISLLDAFFKKNEDIFEWTRPKGGCIGFPKLKLPLSSYDYCEQLFKEKGVVLLPNTVYDLEDNHFRIGFGRSNMPAALQEMDSYVSALRAKH